MSALGNRHPGPHLADMIRARNLTVTDAAHRLQTGRPNLSMVLNGHRAITPSLALRIPAVVRGHSARWWLDRQLDHDLAEARVRHIAGELDGR